MKSYFSESFNKSYSEDIIVGLWLNNNWNIEILKISLMSSFEKINGIMMFKRIRIRGGSAVIGIPYEIIKTLEIIGKTEFEYFNIVNYEDGIIELIPLDCSTSDKNTKIKERARDLHLFRK